MLEDGSTALQRLALGRSPQSLILTGLRGVGKTVLLVRLRDMADGLGFKTTFIEAHEGKRLAEALIPDLRSLLFSFSMIENAKEKARRGLRVLKSFIGAFKITINELDLEIGVESERGTADTGDIENDLPALLVSVAEAALAANKNVAIFVDEVQYFSEDEFSALIMAIHRINQHRLPLILMGAGLPQVLALAGESKSYAERLFRYPRIGALAEQDARAAIITPVMQEDAHIDDAAVGEILRVTHAYPYFLQQWGHDCWNAAQGDRITAGDVITATSTAIRTLDEGFFKVRFDRCTPSERRYMRALAELGAGPQRSGDVAQKAGIKVTTAAPTRAKLISKGMVYAPAFGDTEFTVPLFDEYMLRAMDL